MSNNDYVKREDIFPAVTEIAKEIVFGNQDDDKVVDIINSIPAADVEPKRKMGQWIDVYVSNPARMRTKCSECGMFSGIGGIPSNRHKPYCPNCGSPMLPEPPKGEDNAEGH